MNDPEFAQADAEGAAGERGWQRKMIRDDAAEIIAQLKTLGRHAVEVAGELVGAGLR